MRKPVIGVMGGSRARADVGDMARRLGQLIAERGWVLLNGGRDAGVMAASAAGAKVAGGLVVGVLPGSTASNASPHLDIALVTGMGDARNVINVLSSDVVIACPGGLGTLSEIVLALKRHKHVIALNFMVPPQLEKYRRRGLLHPVEGPDEAVALAGKILGERPPGSDSAAP